MSQFDLSGKVAVITGSSRGIGRAIAEELAVNGAKVVISSRKQEACDQVACALNDRHGAGTALAVAANISSKEALRTLVDAARQAFGRIAILVCNAASNPHYGSQMDIDKHETGDGAVRTACIEWAENRSFSEVTNFTTSVGARRVGSSGSSARENCRNERRNSS